MDVNFYEILELRRECTCDEIKASFRRLAKKHHPDVTGECPAGTERYHKIRTAYEILINPSLRKNYDYSLRQKLADEEKATIERKLSFLDCPTKLEIILAFSTTRPSFRASFAASCLNQLAEGKNLTDRQKQAIDNVIIAFSMDIDFWLDEDKREQALAKFFENEQKGQPSF